MGNKGADIEGLKRIAKEAFAPMIQQLGIEPVSISETGAAFFVPGNDFMMRTGDIVCGQAIASIADSVGVLTLFAHNEEPRVMTTVDMTTHFMRPVANGGMDVEAKILSNGRRMATVQILIKQRGSVKASASTTCAYAYV